MADTPLRLGGMALRNGLLIHGPTHWAPAARAPDGEIEVASEKKPRIAPGAAERLPGLRGPLKLAEAMAVLPRVRRRLPVARLPFQDWRGLAAGGAPPPASRGAPPPRGAPPGRGGGRAGPGLRPAGGGGGGPGPAPPPPRGRQERARPP